MKKLLSFILLACSLPIFGMQDGAAALSAAPAATIVRLQAADGGTCEVDSATLNSHLVDNALRLAQGSETIAVPVAPTQAVLQCALDVHSARQTSDLEALVAQMPSADLVQILNTYEFLFGHTGWQSNAQFFNRFQSPDINFTFFAYAILDKIVHELGAQPLGEHSPHGFISEVDENDAVLWRFIEHRFQNDVVNTSLWRCQTLNGHSREVCSVAWSPDGQTLATGSCDRTAKLWRPEGSLIATLGGLDGHTGMVNCVAWSSDGQTLVTGSYDRTAKLWRPDGTLIATLGGPHGHTDWVLSVAWSPDGQTLATGSKDRTAKLWRPAGTLIAALGGPHGHTDWVWSVAWSPDGQTLATGSYDRTAKLWRPDGLLIATLGGPQGHTGWVLSVAWSPDGQTLATGSKDRTAKLWRPDGTLIATLGGPNGHSRKVNRVAWSPDGQTLATGSKDRTAKLWRPNGTLIATLGGPDGHTDLVNCVAWSPDGQTLATGSKDCTAKLWRPDGTLIATLGGPHGHTDWVLSVAWRPDGQTTLATCSWDHTAQLWRHSIPAHANLSTLEKLLLLKFARQKTLTPDELENLQPLIDTLPEPAVAFIAQCAEQQS